MIELLASHVEEIRARGVSSLLLIGLGRDRDIPAGQPVDFLVELQPPLSYAHWLEVRIYLANLLDRKVDLTIADPRLPAVQPFLDPSAVRIC
jgi:predicted nucleotidyltransferase